MAEKKDIQIFLGVQIQGEKYVVDIRRPIEEYENAIFKKVFIAKYLDKAVEDLKDALIEGDRL